jgi:hypothetical protein
MECIRHSEGLGSSRAAASKPASKPVRRVGIIGVLAASLATPVVSASIGSASAPSAAACGGVQWRLTTFSDPDRAKVVLSPRATTIGGIAARATPRTIPTRRRPTAFQRQTWQVAAQITDYHLVGNIVHITLSDQHTYVDAAIPAPSCLPATARARSAMIASWRKFTTDCGHPSEQRQPLGAVGYVSGVGSWSTVRSGPGNAPNGATLSPVTGFRFVAGCGA